MAAVDRVLPWRRQQNAAAEELTPLLTAYRRRHPKGSVAVINRAYAMAKEAHRHQHRSSGESYINHPLAVARIVADLGLDDISLAAALLHDAVEDTEITLADVESAFGPEVAQIVDGVTKLERLQFDSREAQQAATMRKMLVAMARDLRVLIIKLADRLHNMRTIAAMPIEKQHRIAHETLEIYAPLAHRLGIQELKQHLEDLSFAALYPKRFAELDQLVATRSPERETYLAKAIAELQARLNELGIKAEITGRGKHLWSIYEKMVQKGGDFDAIFDLIAVRVIVETVKDCYGALGCIHGRYKPVVGRFKDYIAMPKFNLYQSLHTTVIGPGGKVVEMQIRTREMHARAEWGVAAHWAYKDDASSPDIDWLNRIIDWQADVSDPAAFMENLKTDLEQDEVFVFTPKGNVVTLPIGATAVDFAYAVHTEVGHRCMGAKVNGRLVPLHHTMKSGDTCEIFTNKAETAGPSRDWLKFVQSQRARNKIKHWFSRERRDDMIEIGRDLLAKEFRRVRLPAQRIWSSDALTTEIEAASYADLDSLLVAIGEGHAPARSIAQKVARSFRSGDDAEQLPATVLDHDRAVGLRRPRNEAGVHVEGLDDVLVRLSRCCTPVPGDDIVGFVTRGRGVSVHRADCANAEDLINEQAARVLDVEWDAGPSKAMFRVAVEVVAFDRPGLLRDVAKSLSEQHVNIVSSSTKTGSDRVAKMRFEFEFADPTHIESLLRATKQIDSVYDAYRLVPGKGG